MFPQRAGALCTQQVIPSAGILPVLPLSPLLAQELWLLRGFQGSFPPSGSMVQGLLKSWWLLVVWEDMALARGTRGVPARCLQELHSSPDTAQGCRAQPRGAGHSPGCRARGCSLAKGLGTRTPPLEAETLLLSWAGVVAMPS